MPVNTAVPMDLRDSIKEILEASKQLKVPLEIKVLSALVVLFLFLLFLITVLWDRYGKEIGELYTCTNAQRQTTRDVHVHDVADEFSIYQKLPTFFYEYVPRRKTTAKNDDKVRECKT